MTMPEKQAKRLMVSFNIYEHLVLFTCTVRWFLGQQHVCESRRVCLQAVSHTFESHLTCHGVTCHSKLIIGVDRFSD